MNVDTIPDFLAEQRDPAPEDLQPLVLEFETLWERKLRHQLTNQLIDFFNNPAAPRSASSSTKSLSLKCCRQDQPAQARRPGPQGGNTIYEVWPLSHPPPPTYHHPLTPSPPR